MVVGSGSPSWSIRRVGRLCVSRVVVRLVWGLGGWCGVSDTGAWKPAAAAAAAL